MATNGDLIDFEVIENSKENIQSLPSGRSAKALAAIFSPVATKSPSHSQDVNASARAEFEKELSMIDESDDPLDIYDRYAKWTLDTYPSAQATSQSQLLPLLERATKAFIGSKDYKNDPRYLKLWLLYIRLFSDSPRETFVYLSRHAVGENLALYYEEFAAWLEGAGRWTQAEEIYTLGIDKAARPTERLARRYREFEARLQARPEDVQEPSSPALPVVRAALAAKTDPFASAPADPQAASRTTNSAPKSRKQKLEIFSDAVEQPVPALGSASKGWDNIGTMAERKKENTMTAKPWAGETLSGTAKTNLGMPKMMIFKDESQQQRQQVTSSTSLETHPSQDQRIINQRTGKTELVFVDLEAVYPEPSNPEKEFCFEELRAARRGWLQRDWRTEKEVKREEPQHPPLIISSSFSVPVDPLPAVVYEQTARAPLQSIPLNQVNDENVSVPVKASKTQKLMVLKDENIENIPLVSATKALTLNDENDENAPPSRGAQEREIARRIRREERANKTRKIKVGKAKAETTTVQTNLSSPKGPKLRPKRNREPTMTLHSKVAMDEVYDLFNQPLKVAEEQQEDSDSEDDSEEEVDDDDYTSGAESTTTGHMSAPSEFGDDSDDEDITHGSQINAQNETITSNTGLSDFSPVKLDRQQVSESEDVPEPELFDEHNPGEAVDENDAVGEDVQGVLEDVTTPTSPLSFVPVLAKQHIPVFVDEERRTNPYRNAAQAAQSRLPFMTPIVERTESSLGTVTTRHEKDYFNSKTPCPRTTHRTPTILENDEPCSSPFEDMLNEAIAERDKITKPNSTKATCIQDKILGKSRPKQPALSKGPIIKDTQCNPMDDLIRQTILSEMQPPLTSYEGFFDYADASYNRKTEIRKHCKAMANAKSSKTEITNTPFTLAFPNSEHSYTILREVGAGAYAPVYLVSHPLASPPPSPGISTMGHGAFASRPTRGTLEALKLESPSSGWEFHMLRLAARRLSLSRAAGSIIAAHELHHFADESYLVEDFRGQGTLLDLVNACAADKDGTHGLGGNGAGGKQTDGLDEPLAMFFAVELLRTLEALHANAIVHCDLKADNILLRLDPSPDAPGPLTEPYAPDGAHGWSAKGVSLIDFGRAIDMRAFTPGVGFIADWPTGATDCAEMRECRPWTYQADYHGLAAILHTLLFGRYIDTVVDKGAAGGAGLVGGNGGKVWRLRESLKRYWQGEIWGEAFALLLNPGRYTEGEEGGRMPCLKGLSAVRGKMEAWLEANGERSGVGLRARLARVEAHVNGGARRR